MESFFSAPQLKRDPLGSAIMNSAATLVRTLSLAVLMLAPTASMAQGAAAGHLLEAQIRVRVDVQGLDSTEWFRADIRHTIEGCQLIQLRDVAWQDGRARVDSQVPMNNRAVLQPRRVREIQTRATDTAVWQTVDVGWFKDHQTPRC